MPSKRWFGRKSQKILGVHLEDLCVVDVHACSYLFAFLRVDLGTSSEEFFVPLIVEHDADAQGTPLFEADSGGARRRVFDLADKPSHSVGLLDFFAHQYVLRGLRGSIGFHDLGLGRRLASNRVRSARASGMEQSNVSVFYDRLYYLKQYRHLAYGDNPDLEVPFFLTRRAGFRHTPAPLGYAYYEVEGKRALIFVVYEYVDNLGDGWTVFTGALTGSRGQMTGGALELLGDCEALGSLTAKMHLALASGSGDPRFEPEETTRVDVEGLRREYTSTLEAAVATCRRSLDAASPTNRQFIERFLERSPIYEELLDAHLEDILLSTRMIRIHGDYHLGQVLKTKDGYSVIDFEGEPLRSLEERRGKSFAVKDVAGMVRSIDYAFRYASTQGAANLLLNGLPQRAREAFLESYWKTLGGLNIVPKTKDAFMKLLRLFEAEKALYEVTYELENRPDWVWIPLSTLVNNIK